MNRGTFDTAAAEYDDVFTDSAIGRLQRDAVHRYLNRRILDDRPLSILELGCGTGEDAIHFAAGGHQVVATDQSLSMLEVTRRKAEDRGLTERIQTCRIDLRNPDLTDLGGPFDLVFSNFGALNCIDGAGLKVLAAAVAEVTTRGSHLIVVVMPRACLLEMLYFLGRGRPRTACRRLGGGPVSATVGQSRVTIWYHGPGTIRRTFARHFTRRAVAPIGFAVPPSYLENRFGRHQRLLTILDGFDRRVTPLSPLASISDHALIDLERR